MMKQFVNYIWFVAKGNALIGDKKLYYYFYLILCFCFVVNHLFQLILCCYDECHHQKKIGEEIVYFNLQVIYSPSVAVKEKAIHSDSEAVTESEFNETLLSVMCFTWLSYTTQYHLPAKECHYSQWSVPLKINH